jgi:serine/threonine-protein kinase RIO1
MQELVQEVRFSKIRSTSRRTLLADIEQKEADNLVRIANWSRN